MGVDELPRRVALFCLAVAATAVGVAALFAALDPEPDVPPAPAVPVEVGAPDRDRDPIDLEAAGTFLTDNYAVTPWFPAIVGLSDLDGILVVHTHLSADAVTDASRICVAASAALDNQGHAMLVSVRDVTETTLVRRTSLQDRC